MLLPETVSARCAPLGTIARQLTSIRSNAMLDSTLTKDRLLALAALQDIDALTRKENTWLNVWRASMSTLQHFFAQTVQQVIRAQTQKVATTLKLFVSQEPTQGQVKLIAPSAHPVNTVHGPISLLKSIAPSEKFPLVALHLANYVLRIMNVLTTLQILLKFLVQFISTQMKEAVDARNVLMESSATISTR